MHIAKIRSSSHDLLIALLREGDTRKKLVRGREPADSAATRRTFKASKISPFSKEQSLKMKNTASLNVQWITQRDFHCRTTLRVFCCSRNTELSWILPMCKNWASSFATVIASGTRKRRQHCLSPHQDYQLNRHNTDQPSLCRFHELLYEHGILVITVSSVLWLWVGGLFEYECVFCGLEYWYRSLVIIEVAFYYFLLF